MVEETPEMLAERIRQQVDAALTRRLENPVCLAPASLIRILYQVIEKHLSAGLLLDEIANALQDEGYQVTKGHLVRHLGTIREEHGLPPLRRGKRKKGEETERQRDVQEPAGEPPSAAPEPRPQPSPSPAPPAKPAITGPAKLHGAKPSPPPFRPEELVVDPDRRVVRLDGVDYTLVGWVKTTKHVAFRHPGIPEPGLALASPAGVVNVGVLEDYDISSEPLDY